MRNRIDCSKEKDKKNPYCTGLPYGYYDSKV